jgi:TetR/AcrR family transcriptional repressor of bet genes
MRTSELKRPKTQPEINRFRRESLMSAAVKVVAEHGIENTTIVKICEAANVSRGLANHYFDSKEDLLLKAYERLLDEVMEVTAKAGEAHPDNPREQVRAMISAIFGNQLFSETTRAAYLCFWTASLSNPQLLAINKASRRREVRAMERLLRRASEQDNTVIDVNEAAVSLIGMIDGFWLSLSLSVEDITPTRAVAMCHRYVDMLLDGPSAASKG